MSVCVGPVTDRADRVCHDSRPLHAGIGFRLPSDDSSDANKDWCMGVYSAVTPAALCCPQERNLSRNTHTKPIRVLNC